MASLDCLRTLYEEWQLRRDRLLQTSPSNDLYRRSQLRILDYLLRRYHNSPEARRMVASPRLADFNMNDRALIVHQHLARRDGPTVSTTAEAGLRIKAALERMYSTETTESQVADPSGPHSSRSQELEHLYLRLCHLEGRQRVFAAIAIGELGTLEDIGLFCDLLALPPDREEHPRERAALSHALARLAGVTSARFEMGERTAPGPQPNEAEDLNETNNWICGKCRESVPAHFEICWSCGTSLDGVEDPRFLAADTSRA